MKVFALTIIGILLSTGMYAQINNFGGRFGINIQDYYHKIPYSRIKIGLSGGLFLDLKIDQNISFETGLNIEQKGVKAKSKPWDGHKVDQTQCINNTLITVPFLVKLKTNILMISFGPYAGYLLKSVLNTKGSVDEKIVDHTLDRTEILRKFEFGAYLGAGKILPIGNNFGILFDLRLNAAFNSLEPKKASQSKQYGGAVSTGLVYFVSK